MNLHKNLIISFLQSFLVLLILCDLAVPVEPLLALHTGSDSTDIFNIFVSLP